MARLATEAEMHQSTVGDGEGDLDCVLCANPALSLDIEHAFTGNCVLRLDPVRLDPNTPAPPLEHGDH